MNKFMWAVLSIDSVAQMDRAHMNYCIHTSIQWVMLLFLRWKEIQISKSNWQNWKPTCLVLNKKGRQWRDSLSLPAMSSQSLMLHLNKCRYNKQAIPHWTTYKFINHFKKWEKLGCPYIWIIYLEVTKLLHVADDITKDVMMGYCCCTQSSHCSFCYMKNMYSILRVVDKKEARTTQTPIPNKHTLHNRHKVTTKNVRQDTGCPALRTGESCGPNITFTSKAHNLSTTDREE